MADLALDWAGDLGVDVTGDLAIVTNNDEVRQRVVRRFLTTSVVLLDGSDPSSASGTPQAAAVQCDYVFEPTYGGSARAFVGHTVSAELAGAMQNRLSSEAQREPEVANNPAPLVNVVPTSAGDGVSINATVYTKSGGVLLVPQIVIQP